MANDEGGWTLVVGIDGTNRNHYTTGDVSWTGSGSTAKGRFSDTVINQLHSSAERWRFTCSDQTRYYSSLCAFGSLTMASGECLKSSPSLAGALSTGIDDPSYFSFSGYDIGNTFTSSTGYYNGCAKLNTFGSDGSVWVR